MKKFMVLALVLGIAGLASAGLDLNSVAGLSYAVDTATQTVTISATSLVTAFELGSLIADKGALHPGAINGALSGGKGDDPIAMGLTSYPAGSIVAVAGTTGTATGITGVLYTFTYTGNPSLVTIGIESEWGLNNATAWFQDGQTLNLAGYTMTIVPEPITMVLLGLGGLFIRRK